MEKKVVPIKTLDVVDVLHTIQKTLKVPKGQRNKFGNYNYRSCEDIVEAVKKLLPEGYVLTFFDEIALIGERHYVKASCILRSKFNDPLGSLVTTAYAREPLTKKGMDEAQITGATSSYARKYAANAMFMIDDTKDADHESVSNPEQKGFIRPMPKTKYPKDNTSKDIPDNKPTNDKEALYNQIEEIVKQKKITKGALTAIKKGICPKESYPVGWEVKQMIQVRDKLLALKGYEEPF